MRYKALIPVVLALLVLGWIQVQQPSESKAVQTNSYEGSRLSAAEHDKALKAFPFRAEVTATEASAEESGPAPEGESAPTKL
ncbi:hypothetical protein [Ferrimonas sp. YFM]|uniref:hypothetical protein n=1 Tax=Ferrimonas sp. YFM TaxID=3028878 RepID=UPI00257313B3|nr:hypothetical protein [Ferrimonas sp. YFM]BDY04088.1 hypothetical protein F0521_11290 [Ferrimonas sp. YFM]